ncbi:MAG: N-acetylneuraminate synthase family protein [Planctomycetota bacterium]
MAKTDTTSRTEAGAGGPVVIAEIGVNHDGRVDQALGLVRAAADAGADAVKFQLFRPDRLLSREAGLAAYQEGSAESAAELLSGLTLTVEELATVRDAATGLGLAFVVTPFSPGDVEDLRGLGVDAVKIASPDVVNTPLLGAAAGLDVPMLVSTGAADLEELQPAVRLLAGHRIARETAWQGAAGTLLQCVSSYPTPVEEAGLGGMAALRELLDAEGGGAVAVGYSDHTGSVDTGGWAVAAGAAVVEKHLTHDRSAAGPDHAASLDPAGFAAYVRRVRLAASAMGGRAKRVGALERDVRRVSRQSVAAAVDLDAGRVLRPGDLTVMRPGTGVPAAELERMVGRRLTRAVEASELLHWDDLDGGKL